MSKDNKFIISGATGLVGRSVSRYLLSQGCDVLCLGRRQLSQAEAIQFFGSRVFYLSHPMREISLLPAKAEAVGWAIEETIFINFAWAGDKGLSDGGLSKQLDNAIYSAEAVKVAKKMGCTKFINSGSMEETLIEIYSPTFAGLGFYPQQLNYGLAKLAARDMSKMVAYLEGIDYVHTRMSVPLTADLSRGTYVATTLKKIANGENYEKPKSSQPHDFVLLDDVCRAYKLIGEHGVNKADYFIGTGRPATLEQHFEWFKSIVFNQNAYLINFADKPLDHLFDPQPLAKVTGFIACNALKKIASRALKL